MDDSSTFLQALVETIRRASAYNKNDQAPPAAVLWPDRERQWTPLLPQLREQLPLLTYDAQHYVSAERRGPAYWLRCMLAGTLVEDRFPAGATPVVYLPNIGRQELRAVEDCPRALQPLTELQYRGALWTHKNGRDWTVAGFLQSAEGGLGIPVASDTATREALLRALPMLARETVAHLRREAPLRAAFLDALLNPDEVRQLLLWMNDPKGRRAKASSAEWAAFCNVCQRKYGFNPQQDGELAAGQRLGQPAGEWDLVWQRFLEAPDAYPNLPDLLRRARPIAKQLALFDASPYSPQDNDAAEAALRDDLLLLADNSAVEARAAIYELEGKHGKRRGWVWAKLDNADLAEALAQLVHLAQITEKAMGGPTVAAIADAYAEWGWQADAAVLAALATVEKAEDVAAVKAALLPLYRPWLEKAAHAFQQAILPDPAHNYLSKSLPAPTAGTCILFADALRFDLAQRLLPSLRERGYDCQCRWGLAGLPTVTSTAKPAIAPVADKVSASGPSLVPAVKATGAPLNVTNLRKLLQDAGYQVLGDDEVGNPSGLAWTETGAIDQYGHGHGWKIALHVQAELRSLERRIAELLDAGWKRVIVITDHGWLMLPGGLPKVELPEHLTLARKGRCAVLKDGAQTDQPRVPWHWDHNVLIAVPPGIMCYEAGKEYDHGGLSPQECVVPIIEVSAQGGALVSVVSIKSSSWKGLRCQVHLSGAAPGTRVDIRSKAADPTTSLVEKPKPVNADGSASLPVPDDDRAGEAAFLVALSEDGTVLAQSLITIGG